MSLQDYTDDEIIEEVFRRIYNDNNSTLLAAKLWTLNDICHNEQFTEEEKKQIAEYIDIEQIMDCYQREWDAIDKGIEKWKSKTLNEQKK